MRKRRKIEKSLDYLRKKIKFAPEKWGFLTIFFRKTK